MLLLLLSFLKFLDEGIHSEIFWRLFMNIFCFDCLTPFLEFWLIDSSLLEYIPPLVTFPNLINLKSFCSGEMLYLTFLASPLYTNSSLNWVSLLLFLISLFLKLYLDLSNSVYFFMIFVHFSFQLKSGENMLQSLLFWFKLILFMIGGDCLLVLIEFKRLIWGLI